MEKYDLIKSTLKCIGRGDHLQVLDKTKSPEKYYCSLYAPTSQREHYECPFLTKHLLYLEKKVGDHSVGIPVWECTRLDTELSKVRETYKQVKADLERTVQEWVDETKR